MVVFGLSVCIRPEWLNSGKSGFSRAKMDVFGQKRLFSDKVVVFWQSGCIRAKVVVFGQK